MKIPLQSFRSLSIDDSVSQILVQFDQLWQSGGPVDLRRFVYEHASQASPAVIGALAKIDLQYRFDRGESIQARWYLDQFPELAEDSDRAVSLIFEEYCLCDETGREPVAEEFCDRYASWADSLHSQLNLHRMFTCAEASQSTPTEFPRPGDRFAKFDLDSVLGKGGAACVFLARDGALGGCQFVLKVSQNRGAEPTILGQLKHRHIIPVLSVEVEPATGLRGLCMPYLPGPTLDRVVAQLADRPLPKSALEFRRMILAGCDSPNLIAPVWCDYPTNETYSYGVAWIIRKLAEALAYAHERQILHRDVKPANVLLSNERGPQLFDFNLAHTTSSAEEAEVAVRGGTLPYMAPEQLRAFLNTERWDQVGVRADVYALGLVLRELLTGESPEPKRKSRVSLPRALQEALDERALPQESTRRRFPHIPPVLSAIVDHCLAFEPSERYQSAADLAEDLGNFLSHIPTKHVKTPYIRERVRNWFTRGQRGRKIAVAAAILGPLCLWGASLLGSRAEFRAAEELFRSGNYRSAAPVLETWVTQHPNDVRATIYLAISRANNHEEDSANQLLKAVSNRPEALPILREELARAPESALLKFAVADALMMERKPAEAEAIYRSMIGQLGDLKIRALLGLANAVAYTKGSSEVLDLGDQLIKACYRGRAFDLDSLVKLVDLELRMLRAIEAQGTVDQFLSTSSRLLEQSVRLRTAFPNDSDNIKLSMILEGSVKLIKAESKRLANAEKSQTALVIELRKLVRRISQPTTPLGALGRLYQKLSDDVSSLDDRLQASDHDYPPRG